uniref:probable G-protein coupled receptor 139 isoform X1 n=1 Tax=Pristiophorus japonicus TaxID=55135 RepID=UPI00398E3586
MDPLPSPQPHANLLTIMILLRGNCGLCKCVSVYMVAMATADLLVMIINILVNRILRYHFPHSFLSYTVVCKMVIYLQCVALYWSVWFTVSFTFDRFVSICCEKFKAKYCTVRTAAAVITSFSVVISLKSLLFWFGYGPERIINNVQWGCSTRVNFFSSPLGVVLTWMQNACFNWLAFALILLFNCLIVRRILVASRARRVLRGHGNENQSDPEMKNRRRSIILLFTISGSFVLLWLTTIVTGLNTKLKTTVHYRGDFSAPSYIAAETGFMLMYLSSCTNTCIYAATQTKFRTEMKEVMKIPGTFIVKKIKSQSNVSCQN